MAADLTFAQVRSAVIAALERAAVTLKRLPLPQNGMPAPERSSWPMAPNNHEDAYGYTPSRAPRIAPGAKAISELDRILPWLGKLDNTTRRLVWARAARLSWPRLAREFGLSVGQVRYRWNDAIDCIVATAVRDTMMTGSAAASNRGSCQTDRLAR